MADLSISKGIGSELLEKLKNGATQDKGFAKELGQGHGKSSFIDYLKDGIQEVAEMQKSADKAATDVSTGKNTELHDAMLAVTQAELSFNLMVQVRNKALEAYQEIMRMPV